MKRLEEPPRRVDRIRVSLGTAIALGLCSGVIDTPPTTLYLLTYRLGRCSANCLFCAQARSSAADADRLSRVTWPTYPLEDVLRKLRDADEKGFQRVCLQTLTYPGMFEDLTSLLTRLRENTRLPVSISCQPLDEQRLAALKSLGVDRLCIPLDAATEELFERVKGKGAGGPYRWGRQLASLFNAGAILGQGRATTHFIVGLGETDRDLLTVFQAMADHRVLTSLFAFTPLKGTAREHAARPPLKRYRRLQVAHYLISQRHASLTDFTFAESGELTGIRMGRDRLKRTLKNGRAFQTYGCPGCNRPYYTEPASGPLYNYPRTLTQKELEEAGTIAFEGIEFTSA